MNKGLKAVALGLSAYVLLSLPLVALNVNAQAATENNNTINNSQNNDNGNVVSKNLISEASDPNWGNGESQPQRRHFTCKKHGKRSHYWWRVLGISSLVVGGVVLGTIFSDTQGGNGDGGTPSAPPVVGNSFL